MIDPEIVEDFKQETQEIISELTDIVEQLEDTGDEFPAQALQEFAQRLDRIMGTAKTLLVETPKHSGLIALSRLGEICKATGYKAASCNYPKLIPIFAAFWADTIEVIEDMTQAIDNPAKTEELSQSFSPVLQKRLEWLAKKVIEITKNQPGSEQSQIQVDALLSQFGL